MRNILFPGVSRQTGHRHAGPAPQSGLQLPDAGGQHDEGRHDGLQQAAGHGRHVRQELPRLRGSQLCVRQDWQSPLRDWVPLQVIITT